MNYREPPRLAARLALALLLCARATLGADRTAVVSLSPNASTKYVVGPAPLGFSVCGVVGQFMCTCTWAVARYPHSREQCAGCTAACQRDVHGAKVCEAAEQCVDGADGETGPPEALALDKSLASLAPLSTSLCAVEHTAK